MRRRRREQPPRWARGVSAVVGLGAAGVALWRVGALRRPSPTSGPAARESWTCGCGQRFVVAGRDRHRIYWVEGAAEKDPVLSDLCPSCKSRLPAESGPGVAR